MIKLRKKRILSIIRSDKILSNCAFLFSLFIPNSGKFKKIKNILINADEINSQRIFLRSTPISIRIAPINICNYRCLFCEIHKDNLLFPDRKVNIFSMEDLKKFEYFLSKASSLSFYGGSEEPLLNKNFGEIVEYLLKKYGIKMSVNTNASALNKKLAEILVKNNFNDVLVSYHAGSKSLYKKLTSRDIEIVNENIRNLIEIRNKKDKNKPEVIMNYAIHKANVDDYRKIIDNAQKLGVDGIMISKYYGGRNKLQDKEVSFDYDIDRGNEKLKEIYAYSKVKKVKLIPSEPEFWKKKNSFIWEENNYDKTKKCYQPWSKISFNPVLDEKDCFYVGICNRIELFKLNYKKMSLNNKEDFNNLWNHPILQYLRKTVNSESGDINPICKYCKNFNREILRNISQEEYSRVRDEAVRNFFSSARKKRIEFNKIEGLEVLSENPYSDDKFKDKLKELPF